ncbi:hypothetical protein MNB_ARC-1_1008 [hydrothermal vent metagenome]|uniref:RDD domain-containing protein n=1 Tax=hydrothermal vent metagenome TaxID=652676 RepID=A0A3B1E603_9ZZZZ
MNTDQEHLDKLDIEGIKLSSFNKRLLSFIIDDILIGIIIIISLWSIIKDSNDAGFIISTINKNIIYIFIIKFLYHSLFIWYYGQTIGKMVLKIRAIELSTLDNPNLVLSSIRSFSRLLFEFFFYVGFFFFFISPIRQTLHDKFGKIVIVDDI